LRIVQGLQKVLPELDVFVDVQSLRSGQRWRDEIRRAIGKGLDFIDPAPLEPPDLAPPPKELASLHFGDRHLAYMRKPSGQAELR
jgi:hypothetical protein